MKNFTSDFQKELLLINRPVNFTHTGTSKKLTFNLPTLEDLFVHDEIMLLSTLLAKSVEDLQKMIPGVEIDSHFHFITLIVAMGEFNENFEDLRNSILKSFELLLTGLESKSGIMTFENGLLFEEDLFNSFRKIFLLSLGNEEILETETEEDDDEFTRREKEAEARVRRIKESAAKRKSKQEEGGMEKMLVSILYEFPQYKMEDLFNMNLYTIYYLYKNVGKIANYEVMKIAAGNGLAKDFKYFTE